MPAAMLGDSFGPNSVDMEGAGEGGDGGWFALFDNVKSILLIAWEGKDNANEI